jgi:tetratricopeptide (TPR) repeat protein
MSIITIRSELSFFIKKSLKIWRLVVGDDHIQVAEENQALGDLYFELKAYDKAVDYFNKAQQVCCRIH